jgi:hypothetical protein
MNSELTTCGCASTTAYHRDLCVNRCTGGPGLLHAHVMFVVRCSVCRSVLLVVMFRSHMIHIDSDSERGSCDGGTPGRCWCGAEWNSAPEDPFHGEKQQGAG